MKIVFFGFGENGEKCLTRIIKDKIKVLMVITAPGYENAKIKLIARKSKIPVLNYTPLSIDYVIKKLKTVKAELLVVASFPHLLPKELINSSKYGTINVHASLLPAYRGLHPLNWAIIKNEKYVGVTVHYMTETMDAGDILAQKSILVTDKDDVNSLKKKIISLGSKLLLKVISLIAKEGGRIKGNPQNPCLVSFAPKRYPSDGKISFNSKSRDVFNLVRALAPPYPMAYAYGNEGQKVEFEKAYIGKRTGEILAKIRDYYLISVSDGVVFLKTKAKLKIGDILR